MLRKLRKFFRRGRYDSLDIDPDEIFLDSTNLPGFDASQFEGRLERPISRKSLMFLGAFFAVLTLAYLGRLWSLQVAQGEAYAERSENNIYQRTLIFADRGIIYDRNGAQLAWNDLNQNGDFSLRRYSALPGIAHVVGYVSYPKKDKQGFFFEEEYDGIGGIEQALDVRLKGENGDKIIETDALGNVQSSGVTELPRHGSNVRLSVDSRVQSKMYAAIEATARERGFSGGAGVIMDVRTGEILALTSYPEFSPEAMSNGDSATKVTQIDSAGTPFVNRVVGGLYTPGSIVKPIMAAAALNENIISPDKAILSTGELRLPNPYVPGAYTVFKDWRVNGWTDMRQAIAASSDVYFYVIGGGFGDQKGLGITKIDKYMRLFGLGSTTGVNLPGEAEGTIPTPEWKKRVFDGEDWTLGNTYHTSIGQYGFQVTPLQVVRAIGAIANGGTLLEPTVVLNDPENDALSVKIPLSDGDLQIVREGMRMVVTDPVHGTSHTVNSPYTEVAAKTGTAQLGVSKAYVNSWIVGFFPYEDPKYAFALVMERGPTTNPVGAPSVMRQILDWMGENAPEYLH